MKQPAIRRVMVMVNPAKTGSRTVSTQLKRLFRRLGVEARWLEAMESELPGSVHDLDPQNADLLVAVGGDGTLLQAARRSRGSGIALLGINSGSLGFLTSMGRHAVLSCMPRILSGEYEVSERMTLSVRVLRQEKLLVKAWALNEAVIFRGHHAHMIRLEVDISGHHLSDYLCDGLLLATPTGSTAYSLSAGGPVVSPSAAVFLITPICAHALTNRPVILDARDLVSVRVPPRSPSLALSLDGTACVDLMPGDEIQVRRSSRSVRLLHLPENDFYAVLRQKLRWSGSSV